MVRPVFHLSLHFILPGVIARLAFAERWKNSWFIMVLTMIVDLDHLLVGPIYDPNRCGIGLHPLHSYLAIVVYLAMTTIPKARLLGLGLLIHMALDGVDCMWMALD
jgi:hypothetical protein